MNIEPSGKQYSAPADTAKKLSPKKDGGKGEHKVSPTVADASLKTRHRMLVVSFSVLVIVPVLLASSYLFTRAHDRYLSHVAFSVRSESTSSAMEMLGGIAEISGSSSSDTDILYNFIKSEEMVRALDHKLDLRAIWSQAGTSWWDVGDDPVYAYHSPGTIEDLTKYWGRMVHVFSDSGTGLLDVEAQAFTSKDAHNITQAIYEASSEMINRLSAIAREDKIRHARVELETALERLKTSREILTRFRNEHQIVNPQSSIEGQVGLLSSLQGQLAQALIDLDMLRQTTREDDTRIEQAKRRVDVISNRMEQERKKLGFGGGSRTLALPGNDTMESEPETVFADIVGEYERLAVDREFAEQSYKAALTAYDAAQAEASRQSRYLAAHIRPSMPEASVRPERGKLIALLAIFSSLIWALLVLIAYALRDRR